MQVLVRESRSTFQFYASGRRFCQRLTAKLDFARRQDLLSMAYYNFTPREDYVDIEVVMNDNCMPPLVRITTKRSAGQGIAPQAARA